MKLKLFAIFFCFSLASVAMAKDHILPDSCGDDKSKFEVTEQESAAVLPPPDAGKALIVLIEPVFSCLGCRTQRFAMDGKWIGATKPKTYFTLQVDPGQHHFCSTGPMLHTIAIRSFEVEAGVTYFLQARTFGQQQARTQEEFDSQVSDNKRPVMGFGISLLDEEKARFQIKSYKLVVFKEK